MPAHNVLFLKQDNQANARNMNASRRVQGTGNQILTIPENFEIVSINGEDYDGNGQDFSENDVVVIRPKAGYSATNVSAFVISKTTKFDGKVLELRNDANNYIFEESDVW